MGVNKYRSANWIFGYGAHISFSTGSPVNQPVLTNQFREGCDTVSNPVTGQLLFYTDGNNLYRANHTLKASNISEGLVSDYSVQAITIVQSPANPDIYYLFMVGDWGTSSVTVRAIKYRTYNPVTDVLSAVTTLASPSGTEGYAENLTAALKANGTDYWIITKMKGNNQLKLWTLSSAGVSGPITHTVGFSYTGANRYGQIKVSPDGKKISLVMGDSGTPKGNPEKWVMWDFNDATGTISNETVIISSISTTSQDTFLIGTEFSANSFNCFASSLPSSGVSKIYKYRIYSGSSHVSVNRTGAYASMQRSPLDDIYIPLSFGTSLLKISASVANDNTDVITTSTHTLTSGATARIALPTIPQVKYNPKDYRVYYNGTWYSVCDGDEIKFWSGSAWVTLQAGDKYWNNFLKVWESIDCTVPTPPDPDPTYTYYNIQGFSDPATQGYPEWPGSGFTLAKTDIVAPITAGNNYEIINSSYYNGFQTVTLSQVNGAYRDVILQHSYNGTVTGAQFKIPD